MVHINYYDNPWFPTVLDNFRLDDRRRMDDEEYAWIWEGEYRKNGVAQVFRGKYIVEEFEPQDSWDGPYHGLDWGFSTDPTAAVRCQIDGRTLYISHDLSEVGLELDDTAERCIEAIPGIDLYEVVADSARPESISHVKSDGGGKRKSIPKLVSAKKGKGSVEHGINFIKSFDKVVIHPRCKATIEEFRRYSYKIDRLSKQPLPELVDANNHIIDALRYALEPLSKPAIVGGILF